MKNSEKLKHAGQTTKNKRHTMSCVFMSCLKKTVLLATLKTVVILQYFALFAYLQLQVSVFAVQYISSITLNHFNQ